MKTARVLLVSIASALALTSCNFYQYPDDLVGLGPGSAPRCSIVRLSLESAMLTSSRGGYVELSLTVDNSRGCGPAYTLHADIFADRANQWVGEASVDFDFLDGGESTGANVYVPVNAFPDAAFCTLSWYDDAGNKYSYSASSQFNLNEGGLLSRPSTEGAHSVH